MTEQYISDLYNEMERELAHNGTLSEDEREHSRANCSAILGSWTRHQIAVDTTLPERSQAQVYAEVGVIGDPERAWEIAEQEIRHVIDILRFACIPLGIHDSRTARYIGIHGEYGQGPHTPFPPTRQTSELLRRLDSVDHRSPILPWSGGFAERLVCDHWRCRSFGAGLRCGAKAHCGTHPAVEGPGYGSC